MNRAPPTHSTEALPWLVARGMLRVALIVVICALAILVVPRLLGQELLGVQGGSMGDSLPDGSLIVTSSTAAGDIEVGDVVVLQSAPGQTQIIHRVVEIDATSGQRLATTRGDANDADDPEQFVLRGAVTVPALVLPYLGYLLIFVTTPLGWLLGVAIPASIVTFLIIRDIWREDATDRFEHWTARYGLDHWTASYGIPAPFG